MRDALKQMAGFRNPAVMQDGAQAAARPARETLDDLGLCLEETNDHEVHPARSGS